ncbi:MAG: ATP-binding protein [Myxococcaceae bacterium]
MNYVARSIEEDVRSALARGKSVLLLGPLQTGKTTLLTKVPHDLSISLVRPETRQRYEKHLELLEGEVIAFSQQHGTHQPVVLLDEVQKVPRLLDVAQDLIDRKKARFILTGSSARKLRRGKDVNLLPGRVVVLHLDPLSMQESPNAPLEQRLLFGELPGIVLTQGDENRELDLRSYVTTYLEEEVRAEALVRSLASFSRFLELAAAESGQVVNFRKLSQEIGVAHTTIISYYEILEDCLIVHRVEPWTQSKTRKKLTKAQKYLFFDLGVRRVASAFPPHIVPMLVGDWFEQWVGLQLIRQCRHASRSTRVHFWRDPDGPEVDWVLHRGGELIPIEVKWTEHPSEKDAKHLHVFLSEYPSAKKAFVVCRTPKAVQLSPAVTAVPWTDIGSLTDDGAIASSPEHFHGQ